MCRTDKVVEVALSVSWVLEKPNSVPAGILFSDRAEAKHAKVSLGWAEGC